ncbi:DMT family transporter, partial [Campylobacter coli]|nr:DMT family transporter [Campylobacter coli]
MRKLTTLLAFIKQKIFTLLLLAFFGFFMLYHFESAAYTSMGVANVVFVLLGLWMIFLAEGGTLENFTHLKGLVNAILAGIGYALFLFFTRKLKLGFGLIPLCALLFIGSLYLSIPLFGANLNLNFSLESLILLLALAFLPTIGGFYCTTRALSLAKSNSVQLIELSEPLFAMFFGSLFLAQSISFLQILGGVFILFAIFVHEFKLKL